TGLPNRALLGEQITEALHDAWREDVRPTVLFIDVDRFKNINDSLGHAVGDQVLRLLGRRLRAAVPPHVRIGRISGDEFMALDATVRTMGEALAFADLVLSVFHEPIHVGSGDMYITASIGVAVAKTNGSVSAEELHRNADIAMYRAKDAGRNCVALFDDSMHERVAQRLQIESALHTALDRRELTMYYQPIVDLVTGEVLGFEALMRWHLADGRLVSPAEFIPIAEETGLIVPIGAWALLEGLMQLRAWIDDGVCRPECSMSVNLSPRQLRDPNLLSSVGEALSRSNIAASQLWLEVTEGVMISEPEEALTTMRLIRALGVRLAIDDFGTGYSSLSMMRRFPLQRMKIDRAFVSGSADDDSARSFVHTIVAMADALGLDVVAEGVESMAQLRVLRSLGCRQAQGFLMSPPVPPAVMRATIHQIEQTTAWSGGMHLSRPQA
ncbi:MAG TPA: bifunctional diguanylate cyclase/phosphodiesterase, partial [Ilumatobacteraceae bacterium]